MHELKPAPHVEKQLGLPQYAISSPSKPLKSRKRPMCICALFMHIVQEPDFSWKNGRVRFLPLW